MEAGAMTEPGKPIVSKPKEPRDELNMHWPKCPWCGLEIQDWENYESGNVECPSCNKIFHQDVEMVAWFRTTTKFEKSCPRFHWVICPYLPPENFHNLSRTCRACLAFGAQERARARAAHECVNCGETMLAYENASGETEYKCEACGVTSP